MSKQNYKGKIGYVSDKDLGIGSDKKKGHYVYVREDNGKTVKVNVITSLEDADGNKNYNKINKIRSGYIYLIPFNDADFSRWSALNLSSITISKKKVKNIGIKRLKKRHRFIVGKFSK